MQCFRLWLRLQVDAFRFAPLGYAQGVAWRARGLRVRSRNRLSLLAGRSRHAYRYWTHCKEPTLPADAPRDAAKLMLIVDCMAGAAGLAETLASIPHYAKTPVTVGGGSRGGSSQVASPRELADCIEGDEAWLCILKSGDVLAPGALPAYAQAIAANPGCSVIYTDDDLLGPDGERVAPHFKPDWNPELFDCHDFLTGAAAVRCRKRDIETLSGDDWGRDLLRLAVASGSAPVHIRHVLHHRRSRPAPVMPDRLPRPPGTAEPSVSVIVPTRNGLQFLRTCVAGVRRTDYRNLELLVVDNDSDDPATIAYLDELRAGGTKVLDYPGLFNFSAINNFAVTQTTGEILCFLNNDVEITGPDWLEVLVSQASRAEIGAVGALLLYPDRTVQHAGVVTGVGGGAGHAHRYLRQDEEGYFFRHRLPQRVSAVTAACLVVAKAKFLAVGGFEEQAFPVAFNDVDLCLKLNRSGWQSFYEPRAVLIHHESKSRGSDSSREKRARFERELAALKRKWGTDLGPDPYHSPHLSPFSEQFLVGV